MRLLLSFVLCGHIILISGNPTAITLPLNRRHATSSAQNRTAGLIATTYGSIFDVDVALGNETFKLLVDTGSSDLYVMKTGYKCINGTSNLELPEDECLYSSKTYNVSNEFPAITDETFGVKYGAGVASGVMVYEDVTLNGITAKRQKIGVADRSNPMGDGVNSGLLGLAYPALTSAHPGSNTSNDSYWFNRAVYSPLFNTMYEQGLVEPYFTLALAPTPKNESTSFGGYLTLGGLPPVPHDPNWSVVSVEILENIPVSFTSGKRVRSYWAIQISGATYGSASNTSLTTNSTSFNAFLDSGNPQSFLPAAIVDPINALFSPPAKFSESLGSYIVDCAAKAPTFGLVIGNQTFFHNGADLIYEIGNGVCISALSTAESVALDGIVLNILGVSFLKNVLAVHDFGHNEMRFSKRLDNTTGSTRGDALPVKGSSAHRSACPLVALISLVLLIALMI